MLYFVIPVYNEGKSIAKQLDSIKDIMEKKSYSYNMIIVNDGSTDNTQQILEEYQKRMPIIIARHEINKNVGAAFRLGFKKVLELAKDEDIVITMEADNTQTLKTIELMMQKINEGYEIVLGSFFATGGMLLGAPFKRRVLSWGCNFIYQTLFHIKGIKEYTCFYRAYSVAALRKAFNIFGDKLIESVGFGTMAEMLIKFRRIPLFITEVPMIVRLDLKKGISKIKIVSTIKEHIKIMRKNLFKRSIVKCQEDI